MMVNLIGLALALLATCAFAQSDNAAPAPTWPFSPPRDEFSDKALLDLRSLNEKTAGESGFVRVDAQGDFVRGDGQPIRFWAVNTDVGRGAFVARPLGPNSSLVRPRSTMRMAPEERSSSRLKGFFQLPMRSVA